MLSLLLFRQVGREIVGQAQGISMFWVLIAPITGLAAAISRCKAVRRITRAKTRGSSGQGPSRPVRAAHTPVPTFSLASKRRVVNFFAAIKCGTLRHSFDPIANALLIGNVTVAFRHSTPPSFFPIRAIIQFHCLHSMHNPREWGYQLVFPCYTCKRAFELRYSATRPIAIK